MLVESLTLVDVDANDVHLMSLKDSYFSDPLNDVLALVESLTLVDAESLNDVLALAESERLVLVDSLNDVLVLVESLTLVDVDANDVLALLNHSHLLTLIHLMMCLHLEFEDVLVDSFNDVLCLLSHSHLLMLMHQ